MNWTTPSEIADRVMRLWNKGHLLGSILTGEALFPKSLPIRRPDSRAMAEQFEDVRVWIRELDRGSRAKRGFGYDLEWNHINHRQLGQNRVPASISIPTEADALRLIGKEKEARRFRTLTETILRQFPSLKVWLARYPHQVLDRAADWERILAVLAWFGEHPHSGLYLRQVDIPGVDTKFIETRKALLAELLSCVRQTDQGVSKASARMFEAHHGLRIKPPLIRFRILDADIAIRGLTDISVPVSQFAEIRLEATRVFITENEINGLIFPDVKRSLVIFGLGYGLDLLSSIRWLKGCEIFYWGDIDTHGFAMLDQLRASFPHARSLLMDRETLVAHRDVWGREKSPHPGRLTRLVAEEQELFIDLQANRFADRLRLEQEHIGYGWVTSVLKREGLIQEGA